MEAATVRERRTGDFFTLAQQGDASRYCLGSASRPAPILSGE